MSEASQNLRKRWWVLKRFDDIVVNEIAYYRKFNEEIFLPKVTVWSWGDEEVVTNVDSAGS